MTEQPSRKPTSAWIEHRRDHDDELLGFLVPDAEWWVPVTVFGYPVAEPAERDEAAEQLDRLGLSYLAQRWDLQLEDQTTVEVEIVEASPERVVLKSVDFGSGLDYGTRFTLPAPIDGRLTLR